MRKSFKLVDLDCANCAQKMEDAARKVDGVQAVTVNFMLQKLTLEADDARFEEVLRQVVKVMKRVEPDCEVKL